MMSLEQALHIDKHIEDIESDRTTVDHDVLYDMFDRVGTLATQLMKEKPVDSTEGQVAKVARALAIAGITALDSCEEVQRLTRENANLRVSLEALS